MLDHPWPGDLAVLGDVADEGHLPRPSFGKTGQRCAEVRTCVTVPGAHYRPGRLQRVWMESMIERSGASALLQGGEDDLDAGLAQKLDLRLASSSRCARSPICATASSPET